MLRLELDEDIIPTVQLFGLSSHVRDYRLCWSLNCALGIDLVKYIPDSEDEGGSGDNMTKFYCASSEKELSYTLIQNRTPNGLLVADLKQADFLFFVQYGEGVEELEYFTKLQEAQFVNAVFSLDPQKWNEAFQLIEGDGY